MRGYLSAYLRVQFSVTVSIVHITLMGLVFNFQEYDESFIS